MATPTLVRTATEPPSGNNALTWTPTWTWGTNTAISSGEKVLWVAVVASDGNPTLSETGGAGWQKREQTSHATDVTGAVFTLETTAAYAASAAPAFTITSTVTEQFSAVLFAFKMGTGKLSGFLLSTAATGSSTNSNPPALTNNTGASRDFYIIATRHGDSNTAPSTAPAGYTSLGASAGGLGGCVASTGYKTATLGNSSSEDPGTFTVGLEQWVSYTIGVYEYDATLGRFQAIIII